MYEIWVYTYYITPAGESQYAIKQKNRESGFLLELLSGFEPETPSLPRTRPVCHIRENPWFYWVFHLASDQKSVFGPKADPNEHVMKWLLKQITGNIAIAWINRYDFLTQTNNTAAPYLNACFSQNLKFFNLAAVGLSRLLDFERVN